MGVGACRARVFGWRLAVERTRPSIRAGWRGRWGLQLQLPLGAGAVYEAQTPAETVHALAHVVQRDREAERAAGVEADGGGADQGEPVSLLGLFGGRKGACAQRGD